MIERFILFFVPREYRENEEAFRKCRLLINASFITALFSLSYIFISIQVDFSAGVYAMLLNMILFSFIPFLFKNGYNLKICGNLYVLIGTVGVTIVIYFSGGFRSHIIPWLAVLPITALLLAGKESGWFWTLIATLIALSFGLMSIRGYAFPLDFETTLWKEFAMTTHAGLVLILFVVALVFEQGKHTALTRLEHKNQEVIAQKEIIEAKNKDITDSINYARRIQNAIFPPRGIVHPLLPDSFILYKPKDIVSGDFYWTETVKRRRLEFIPDEITEEGLVKDSASSYDTSSEVVLFAAVDCTGHGVPGAFMSIIGHGALNQAVKEHGLARPSSILNYLNHSVNETLKQRYEDSTVRDGMDISICALDVKNKKLEFAGAINPLYLLRNGKIEEVKGDKQPIGVFAGEKGKPFTNVAIQLKAGDAVYVFSDGYADQFGGPKGKKFKYRQLQELLLSMNDQPMKEQKEILEEKIEQWKGGLEQIDDILVMGVRIA